jgi:predicted nucleic acid-binding protein
MDTNVLLLAAGGTPDEAWKVPIAQRLLLDEVFGVSAQSIAEFINAATRAKRLTLASEDLDLWVGYLADMPFTPLDDAIVQRGLWMHRRYQIQYYDGALLAAAERLGAPTFYSNDLNDGQVYGDVQVINPFLRH